jgi:hypothetical protein
MARTTGATQWPRKHEVQWGKYRWEVGRRVVRILCQTKAPLVRRALKCVRRDIERQDDNE